MNRLVLHVGIPKTGTTSIQDSLFWSDLKEPYRFLSLDTNFANRTAILAYQNPERHRGNFFVETLSSKQFTRYGRFSKKYIQNALSRCAQQRLTPIISAETFWGMNAEELEEFRKDAISYGFTPQIICTRPTNLRCQAVVDRLNRMHRSYCISRTSRYLSDEIKRHLRRRKLIRMNLAKN